VELIPISGSKLQRNTAKELIPPFTPFLAHSQCNSMGKRVFGTTLMIFFIVGFWGLVTKSLDADTIFSSQKKVWMLTVFVCFPFILDMMKEFFSLNLFIIHQIKSEKNAFGAENNESKEATTDSKDDETWKKGMVTSHSTKVIISHYAPNRTRVANQAILSHPTK
jgi:hypothetical protein